MFNELKGREKQLTTSSEVPTDEALQEPTNPVSLFFQILLGLANAGATICLLPIATVLIPSQVVQIDPLHSASSLAMVLSFGALGALIGNPLAGALSDRTTLRLGRRRPWILVGLAGVGMGLLFLQASTNIPLMATSWFLVQFFGNVLLSCFGTIIPDHIPVQQRGTTQALNGFLSPLAIILIDIMIAQAHDLHLAYYLIVGVMVVLSVSFVSLYKEPPLPLGAVPPFHLRKFLAAFWINPRQQPRFGRAWLMWLFLWTSYSIGTGGFFFLYVQNITNYASIFPGHEVKEGIATIQMLQIVVGVPLMMAAGFISDRMRRRKIFVALGTSLIGVGLLLLVFSFAWSMVLAAGVLIGAGFWVFYSLGLTLISQLLPSAATRGKDLGVINIAATLPQIVLPPISAIIVNGLGLANPMGYQVLFLLGIVSVVGALSLIKIIKE